MKLRLKLRLKDCAYFYSLQAGVVIYCMLGIVFHTIAFLMFVSRPIGEPNPKYAIFQYVLALIFIALGVIVYILGLTASALENSTLLKLTGGLLVVEFLYWIILMGISFSGNCNLSRTVCLDNRCAERLYIQNGYWRTGIQECLNRTFDDNATDSGDGNNDTGRIETARLYIPGSDNLEDMMIDEVKNTTNGGAKSNSESGEFDYTFHTNESSSTFEADEYGNISDDSYEGRVGNDSDAPSLWTPIGNLNTKPHFVMSVVGTILLIFLWYLYPIWLIFSFSTQIDLGERV